MILNCNMCVLTGPHLVLYARQTSSGCLSQPKNYWRVWTATWTGRRNWGSGGGNMPRRTCNRTGQFHWTWHGPHWWLQSNHKYIYGTFVSRWVSVWNHPAWSDPSSPNTGCQKMALLLHITLRRLVRRILFWMLHVTRWPVFKYYHLLSPILFSLIAI